MQKIVVDGGHKLKGSVRINGAKNSAVALLPASILADSTVTIEGLPDISDVDTLSSILEEIGADVSLTDANSFTISPENMESIPLPNGKVQELLASYQFMGATLGKYKETVIGIPGVCFVGSRPIDQHIKGLEDIGEEVTNEHRAIYLRA